MSLNPRSRPSIFGALAILVIAAGLIAAEVNSGSSYGRSFIESVADKLGVASAESLPKEPTDEQLPAAKPETLAAFTPGNLVINRVGDGTTNLTTIAHPISVVEYTTAGTLTGNVILLPSFNSGGNNQGGFTDTGSVSAIGGFLHRSSNGQYLTLMGIDAALGTSGVIGTTASIAHRNIAMIDAEGNVSLKAALESTFSTGNPRAAFTTDGNDIWIAGTGNTSGLRYVNSASGVATGSTIIQSGEPRNTAIFAGILFSSTGSAIFRHNAPNAPPKTSSAGVELVLSGDEGLGVNTVPGSFVFLDRSPTIGATNLHGLDTLYVVDGSAIKKFEWNGSSWFFRGKATSTGNLFGLVAIENGTSVDLYVTTAISSNNLLRKVTDTSVFGATFSKVNADFLLLANAGNNYAFRGIALAPVAPPPPPAPEIAVEDTANIDEGGTSDFGGQTVLTSSGPRTFTIKNTGDANLNITLPFGKDGDHSADFAVDTSSTDAVILPDTSTTFTVTFTPAGTGTRTAAIHIENDDADENPFTINLTGTGLPPPTISAVPVVRTAGGGSSNSTIANVTDPADELDSLKVEVNGDDSAVQNGVTVNGISVDITGVVTANIEAAAGAGDATFTLTVTNSGMQSAASTLQVIVLSPCPATGTWTQQPRINASDGEVNDQFGTSVAVSGDTMVFGAIGDEGGEGGAYVFVRIGGVWTLQAKLTASDGTPSDNFGIGVAISGDTAVIGAHQDDGKGAAYVFTRSGPNWTEQQKLTASDGGAGDQFGRSVAISGDTVVAGAHAGNGSIADAGAAYVFTGTGGVWSQQQKLMASDGAAVDEFGWRVAISGDTAIVGAIKDDDLGDSSGSAYIYTRSGTIWSEQEKLTASDGAAFDEFGYGVAISGDTVIVGAVLDEHGDPVILNAGSAYVFTRNGAVWTEQQKLTASDSAGNDLFGFSVGISGDTAIVGARNDDASRGSAYIFTRTGGAWSQQQKLTASDGAVGDQFGFSVAIVGNTAVAGANSDDDLGNTSGSAYVFHNLCPPEIAVEDDDEILNGGTSNFGGQTVLTSSDPKTYTIRNTGSADLTVTWPFVKDGTHAAEFAIASDEADWIIPAGGDRTFTVTFTPGGLGLRTATLEITNNDADENPFEIDLQGIGNATGPTTYTWTPAIGQTDWNVPTNWNPVRLTPNNGDTLIVDGNITPAPTITNVSGLFDQTIRELRIINGASPIMSADGSDKTLSITGSLAGDGFEVVAHASNVTLTGAVPLTISVATGADADINGTLIFDGPHRLIAADAGAIVFASGSAGTTTQDFTGYPFGDGSPGNGAAVSVVFQSGSVYSHNAGSSPFGNVGAPVTVFQEGSLAQWLTTEGFQANGRTYADLNVGNAGTAVELSASGSGNFGFDNLTVISTNAANSSLSFTGTGAGSVSIGGSIRSEGTGVGTNADVKLSAGPTGQMTIDKTGGGTISFETDGNGRGVLFTSDSVVAAGTTLSLGRVLQMGMGADLTLHAADGADITGGTSGYVIGSLKRTFTAGPGVRDEIYPVGTITGYSPVEADYSFSEAGVYEHSVKAHPGMLPGISGSNALGRYWNLSEVEGPGMVTADLTFGYIQDDVTGTEADYKAIRASNGIFTQFDPTVLDTASNFATVNGVPPSGDWSLAEPSAVQAGSLQFEPAAYSVSEGGGTVTLNVTRTGGSDGAVSVQFSTSNDIATAPDDYAANSGTLNWAAGDSDAKSIVVTINEDGDFEGDEIFDVTLSSPTGMAVIGAPNPVSVTIVDNDLPDTILTVTKSGNGTVTSDPAGINCGTECEGDFAEDEQVTLNAMADTGWKFTGWGGDCSGMDTTCILTMEASKSVSANFALITISGSVRLQNAIDRTPLLDDVPVPEVDLHAEGAPPVSGSTDADGKYSLSGFGAGPYTVTPSKADQDYEEPNGVFIDDASLVARRMVGLEPDFTAHQIAAADVSGNGSVSSYDASLIARWVVGLPDTVNRSGTWAITPSSVDHGPVTNDIVRNYDALLFGDVNGDFGTVPIVLLQQLFAHAAGPAAVSLGNVYAQPGSTVVVPLKIENLYGASIRSYQFDIEYDADVLTPAALAADLAGTVGAGMNIIYNVPRPGLLKVAVYNVFGVIGDGNYANLRFVAAGGAGAASQLKVKGFRFNDGKTHTVVSDGSVFVTSANRNTVRGRLVTATGQGVRNTQVTITSPTGLRTVTFSSSLGYFEFGSLNSGESYTLSVQSRRFRFAPLTVAPADGLTSVEMVALE